MPTEERDIQIEDQVDFETPETNTDELTPEVNDFEETQDQEVETPSVDETPSLEPEVSAEPETSMEAPAEVPQEQAPADPVQDTQPTPTPQETSSPGRVMRFEDFVSSRD
jgi:hypothetical protein